MSNKRSSLNDSPLAQLFAATDQRGGGGDAATRPQAGPIITPPTKDADAAAASTDAVTAPDKPAAAAGAAAAGAPPAAPPAEKAPARSAGTAANDGGLAAMVADASTYLAVIRVVGVGGAGINALERMMDSDVRGVEFVAINTDLQQLEISNAPVRLHIGNELTGGLGSGADPEVGKAAAEASYDHLRHVLKGSDMVFVTCGEGGGTGTGAAPVVCRAARELGALTVAIVTTPFSFEGSTRQRAAGDGLDELRKHADTVIVIPNNRLLEVLHRDVSMVEAFRVADDVLRQGVQGITDLITMPGLINVDFADVRTIMSRSGNALMGIGFGTGDNRAADAATSAIGSPLIEQSPAGAGGILLSISGGDDLTLHEVTEAARIIQENASPDANIIFGATIDSRLTGQVWVTVVATNFGGVQGANTQVSSTTRPGTRGGAIQSTPPADDDLDLPSFLQ
ncbi:MAG: Cell division protein FtsZ [Thermoleophilia bacterium]|nr:Cell division protein FtsZ [Thermoleophilia bacterium]